jgi:hypothetical protein
MRFKTNELTDKDMDVLREGDEAGKQRDNKVMNLKDYSLKHRVTISWDLNDDAQRDLMVKLRVGELEVILDAEEVTRALRWA